MAYKDIILKSDKKTIFFYLILVYAFFIIVKPSLLGGIITILLGNLGLNTYSFIKNAKTHTKQQQKRQAISLVTGSLVIILVCHIVYWLNYWFGGWGFWGIVIIAVVLAVYRLIRGWKQYKEALVTCQRYLTGGQTFKEKYGRKNK